MSSNPTAVRAEHPILLIHLIHSTLQPAPRSLLRLHGVIFMHHQDVGADECQQYTRGHSRSRRAPLLQEITIMCCSTRFHSALTRSTSLDLVLMRVPKRRFTAWFYTILYFFFLVCCYTVSVFALFCFSGAAEIPFMREGSNLPSLWLCRALCQTIIFCIAICRLPLQMIDILNRMSGPHINKQAHSWVRSDPSSAGLE